MSTEISNFKKNSMGTTSFDLKLKGMRKTQDFCVYPIAKNDSEQEIKVQSDTRIGTISLITGKGKMSQSHQGGAYFHHLIMDKMVDFELKAEDLEALKNHIRGTASPMAGNNGLIFCDNSNADKV